MHPVRSCGQPFVRLLACTAALLFTSLLSAQEPTASLHIEVKDSSGTPMQTGGKLDNLASGTGRTFRTDAQGIFNFDGLPLGRYRLELSQPGFSTQTVLLDLQ